MPAASAKIIFDAGRVPYLADPWQGLGYVGKSQNRQKHEKGLVKSLIKAGNKAGKKQDHQQRRSRPLYDKLQDAAVAGQILDDNEKLLDNRILDRESVLKAIVFFEIIFCDNHRTYSFRLRILMDDRLL